MGEEVALVNPLRRKGGAVLGPVRLSVKTERRSHLSSSQKSNSQLPVFRIPRRRSNGDTNLTKAELTCAAGNIMGSVARSIMEGSAGMVQNYLDGFGYGHDEGTR